MSKNEQPVNTQSILEVRLFGLPELRAGGEALPRPRSRRVVWLLALLILKHPTPVDRRWLSALFWPDAPEETALASLRKALNDLRHVLGPHAGRVTAPSSGTLGFDPADADVDLLRFDRAVCRADEASLREAVDLVRGSLLDDCGEEWALLERESRQNALVDALERLAALASERGDHAEAVRWLRACAREDPLRESAQRALMNALASSGNVPEATQVYRDLRVRLRDAINAEPEPETRAAYKRLRATARSGADRQQAGEPESRLDVPSNLPHPVTELVGRENELEALIGLLARSRIVTLTGVGGIGKTRLAIETARRWSESHGGECALYLDLAPLRDPGLIPAALAAPLGLRDAAGASLTEQVVEKLRHARLLILFDNCEHLVAGCAPLVGCLTAGCSGVRILATSRQPLDTPGETVWRLAPLAAPDPARLAAGKDLAGALREYPAVRLFLARATQANPSFGLSPANACAIAAICHTLEGIPLAIELAAARVRLLSAEQIAARLHDRFQLLTAGSRTSLARQQTLRAAIDWSFDLLSEPERTLLCHLSGFRGGWTREAAEAVLKDEVDSSLPIAPLLDSLVAKSLVVCEEQHKDLRYRCLDTVREYAAERLAERGDAHAALARHRAYFLREVAVSVKWVRTPQEAAAFDTLERDHDNIRAALDAIPQDDDTVRAAAALLRFWAERGYIAEGRTRLQRLLAEAHELTPQVRANGLYSAAMLAWMSGDFPDAERHLEGARSLYTEAADRYGMAQCLNGAGIVARSRGDLPRARECHERCLALRRELGDERDIAASLGNLALVVTNLGDHEAARLLNEEGLAIGRRMGDLGYVTGQLNNMGLEAARRGDFAAARRLYEEAIEITRKLGHTVSVGHQLTNLGVALAHLGEPAGARHCLTEGLRAAYEHGQRQHVVVAIEQMAEAEFLTGDYLRAARLWGIGVGLREALGTVHTPVEKQGVDQCMAQAQAAAGQAAFDTAFQLGMAMDEAEAVEFALGDDWR